MSIYHLHAQVISRKDGRSSVAAAAYRAAQKLIDKLTGLIHDFTRKRGVDFSLVMLPPNAPSRFSDRNVLWEEVEKIEKRKDAQLARELDVALPQCLPREAQIELAKQFVQDTFVKAGMCADLNVHDLDSGNPHFHVMLTTRDVDADGFGKKNRAWNDRDLLVHWREQWAAYANAALEKHGFDDRIDHRSYAEQGIDKVPQVHLGPQRHAMLKKGVELETIQLQQDAQALKRALRGGQYAHKGQQDAQVLKRPLTAEPTPLLNQLKQIENELMEIAHEREVRALEAAIAAAQQHQRDLRERIKSARIRRTELEEYQRRVEQELNDRNAKAEGVIERAREHVEQARKDQRELEKSLREINEAKAEFEAISPFKRPRKRRELNTEIQEIEAEISAAKQRKQGLGRSIEGLERSIEVGQQHQRSLGARIGAVRNALHHQQKQQKLRRAVKRIIEPRQAPIEQDEIESLDELESVQHRRPRPRF